MKVKLKRAREINGSQKNVNFKIFVIFLGMALFFCIIIIRLLYINIVRGEELTRKALNQLTSTEVVQADRGIIYDRNNKELVVNITKSNVYYNMDFKKGDKYTEKEIAEKKKKVEKHSLEIAKVLKVPQAEIKKKFVGDKVVQIASNVDRDKANELRNLKIEKLSIDDVPRRFYPNGSVLSEVLGFVTDDGNGQYGLESSYDTAMSGIAGKNISIKANTRMQIPLTDEESYAPKEGQNLILTIDDNIQKFAEEAAEKSRVKHNAEEVNIIVQSTKSGEILAMASALSYDANNPKAPVGDEQKKDWDMLTQDEKTVAWYKNWTNFNVSSQYEPGSTFKLITAAAGLEEATTYPLKEYHCPGQIKFFDRVIKCSSKSSGTKTMQQALVESCNITLMKMAEELGPERFYKYVKAFGFGEKTGIDLPAEASGSIPNNYKDISAIRLATMSYGHGIAVTPIQLINSVSAIANGGDLKIPRVVKRLEDRNKNVLKKYDSVSRRKVVSAETSKKMLDIMYKVVEEGTGKNARVEGYKIGGKTGTAYVPSKAGGYEDEYISSFVGVAPIDNPEITVLVVVQKPKGDFFAATVATPAAQEVLKNSLEYLGVEKTQPVEKKEKSDEQILVPNFKNMLVSDAGKELVSLGLKFNTNQNSLSDASIVIKQEPKAGSLVKPGSIVDLYVSSSKEKYMPDLVGKSKEEIELVLKALDVSYNINGNGVVLGQTIAPGTKLGVDSKVEFEMSNSDDKLNTKLDDKGDSNKSDKVEDKNQTKDKKSNSNSKKTENSEKNKKTEKKDNKNS